MPSRLDRRPCSDSILCAAPGPSRIRRLACVWFTLVSMAVASVAWAAEGTEAPVPPPAADRDDAVAKEGRNGTSGSSSDGQADAASSDAKGAKPEDDPGQPKDDPEEKKGSPVTARYKKGLHIETADDSFSARIRWRVQMRLTDVTSPDLLGEEDGVEEETGFRIRRARFKLDGHAYQKWLNYYLEYGIAASVLLTWQFDVARYKKASLRVGQWKVVYNRERVDSSGKQQFVDRSIVNNPFTIDRQQGIALSGRLFEGSRGDSRYAVGVYTGTGRGGGLDEDGSPMYVGRWQWNFLKRDVPFTQSDIKYTPKAIASFAVGAASNRGRFTRWSSSGGGQLGDLPPGEPGQYKTEQAMGEFALMRQGLSVQSEYHFKRVDDTLNNEIYELDGFYAQVGYFFHQIFEGMPKKLELALRYARVDSEQGVVVPADREHTLAVNYFFAGHENKLTGDASYLRSRIGSGGQDDGWRVRLQWDVSF